MELELSLKATYPNSLYKYISTHAKFCVGVSYSWLVGWLVACLPAWKVWAEEKVGGFG